jgi:hypothetical protein
MNLPAGMTIITGQPFAHSLKSEPGFFAAKSLRDARRYRQLAEMYWALALGEEPEPGRPSKARVERARHDYLPRRVS